MFPDVDHLRAKGRLPETAASGQRQPSEKKKEKKEVVVARVNEARTDAIAATSPCDREVLVYVKVAFVARAFLLQRGPSLSGPAARAPPWGSDLKKTSITELRSQQTSKGGQDWDA
jgi:hypothetical protein